MVVSCVWVLESDVKYWARGILYKFDFLNKPELNKVYHSIYNFFLGGRKGKGWRVKSSIDIEGLYLPLRGLSLPLHLEVVATVGSHYWLFLIYCAWCIVVYWCNSYTIVHFSLDIIERFKYKLKKKLNCTWYWFTPLSVSTVASWMIGGVVGIPLWT